MCFEMNVEVRAERAQDSMMVVGEWNVPNEGVNVNRTEDSETG